jgi:hypothetical protein
MTESTVTTINYLEFSKNNQTITKYAKKQTSVIHIQENSLTF